MKGYVIKETSVATQENSTFAGETRVHIIGKGDMIISGTGSPREWENWDYSDLYLASHCYKRECDAKRNYSYRNPENSKFWKSTVEIVEVEV